MCFTLFCLCVILLIHNWDSQPTVRKTFKTPLLVWLCGCTSSNTTPDYAEWKVILSINSSRGSCGGWDWGFGSRVAAGIKWVCVWFITASSESQSKCTYIWMNKWMDFKNFISGQSNNMSLYMDVHMYLVHIMLLHIPLLFLHILKALLHYAILLIFMNYSTDALTNPTPSSPAHSCTCHTYFYLLLFFHFSWEGG